MYKDKTKQKQAVKRAVAKHREGITSSPTSEGITSKQGITYPHIIDKLTDKRWRDNLTYVCSHFRQDMKEVTWLGGYNLSDVCDWRECTA